MTGMLNDQDRRDIRSGALRALGASAVAAVGAAGGAVWAIVQKADWLVVAILLVVAVFLGVIAIVLVVDYTRRVPRSTWSAHEFYRDAANEALAIASRDVLNAGKELEVGVDHGILVGKIDATLRAHGLGHEADRVYPYGSPRHVADYGPDGDALFRHRRMLEELRGRLGVLRDAHAPANQGRPRR